jgi:kynurenine formamidase
MRFVDLSVSLDNNRGWAPWWARVRVRREGHRFGALAIRVLFGLSGRYLRGGLGWANDHLSLSTHGTTHLDAPWHFAPTCEGRPAKTIDQVPLDWCYGPGVKLDLRHKADGEAITVADLQAAMDRIGGAIGRGDIVLIHTGNDRWWGTPDYFRRGSGVSAEATRWLVARGVKVVGIDSFSWDVPLPTAAARAKRGEGDFWEAHYAGADAEYGHLERLTNLGALPGRGFTVCCFPLRVAGGSAGPARVVAILE